VRLDSRLADERKLDLGAGLGLVAPLAASTAVDRLLGSLEPVAITACVRFRVRELRKPIGFCNPYFDSFSPLSDIAEAAAKVDAFNLSPLHIRGSAVSMEVTRGFADEVVVGARGPGRVRAGSTVPVRVALRRRGGGSGRTITVQVPVPAGVRPGERTLVLEGNGFADQNDDILLELGSGLAGAGGADGAGAPGAHASAESRTPKSLARAIAALHRPLGIVAHLRHREGRVVLRSEEVRFDGRAQVSLRVVPAYR
jgi:hypothetical protein